MKARPGIWRQRVGLAGIVVLGAALAYAPIAAFGDDMVGVSRLGILGIALLLVAWRLPRGPDVPPDPPPPSDG